MPGGRCLRCRCARWGHRCRRQRPSPFLPQLIAWEPEHEEEATVVTVRPNFQDSVHVGYVAGLRKFAEYFTSVLCFTTPGDGPRSPPQLVRTHEDGTGGAAPRWGIWSRGMWNGGPTKPHPRGAPSTLAPGGAPVGAEGSCHGCVAAC